MVAIMAFGLALAATMASTLSRDTPVESFRGLQRKADFVVLEEMPHDPRAFTQGLQLHNGVFYEGTGLYGQSSLRKVDVNTGAVLAFKPLDRQYFGEGIVVVDNKVVQITWKERQAFVWDADTLESLGSFQYSTVTNEGWGITTDGTSLIVSDGSEYIFFWDKDSYQETRRVAVTDGFGHPVHNINELEYAHGYIWANVWMSDDIVQIDPATGRVVAFYDFSRLYPVQNRRTMDDVLNGIAFDPATNVFYLTGKRWPRMYKVAICGIAGVANHASCSN